MKDIDSLEQTLDDGNVTTESCFHTLEDTIEKYIHANTRDIPTNRYNPL